MPVEGSTTLTFLAICRAQELTGMFATVKGCSAMVRPRQCLTRTSRCFTSCTQLSWADTAIEATKQ